MSNSLISTHTFMLPMRWDYLPKGYNIIKGKQDYNFDERTDMQTFCKLMQNSDWKRKFYTLDNDVKRYNEMTYFHSYATTTFFDLQQNSEINENCIDGNKVMVYYEIPISKHETAYYKIHTKDKTYELKLCDLNLHVYATGVAIFAIACENHLYFESEDILQINEFGRRLYPQFLSETEGNMTNYIKETFLASQLEIYCPKANQGLPIIEDFSDYSSLNKKEVHQYQNNKYKFNCIIQFPSIIKKLFNDNFVFEAERETVRKVRFSILGDDRMFFQCWYGNNEVSKNMKSIWPDEKTYFYENNSFWYAFMNGDKNSSFITQQNHKLLVEDIFKSTYSRWINQGTLFGFTRDSFVMQTDEGFYAKSLLSVHISTIYYQMAILCLAQRASILRFSYEVSKLADIGKTDEDKATKLIEKLYLNYIEFINKIYFREVTPTIQGIEMYEKFQEVMRIENDAKALKEEIQELYNFAELVKQDKLTSVATFFLPFSLVFGILGANFFKEDSFNGGEIKWLIIGVLVGFILYKITMKINWIKSKLNKFL